MNKSCVFKHQFESLLKLSDLYGNYFVIFAAPFKKGSCPLRELITCWNVTSHYQSFSLTTPILLCLVLLQQELETWELYAGNLWDVDEQNGGWYYLDVLVNKQIWLIKAGWPQRFLPPSAYSTLCLAVTRISGFSKGQVGSECLRSCFTCVQLLVTGT